MDCTVQDGGQPLAGAGLRLCGITIRGRHFAPEELLQIRAVVQDSAEEPRFPISKKVCEVLDWRQPAIDFDLSSPGGGSVDDMESPLRLGPKGDRVVISEPTVQVRVFRLDEPGTWNVLRYRTMSDLFGTV